MSSLQIAWLVVGLGFYYSVFSTYDFCNYQFGYQHKLVSLGACCTFAVPQLSARPLGRACGAQVRYFVFLESIVVAIV